MSRLMPSFLSSRDRLVTLLFSHVWRAEITTLEEITLDVNQHIEVKAAIGDVFPSVLHRFGEGFSNPKGESLQMVLEQWPGGRWFRDRGTASATSGDTCRSSKRRFSWN